MDMISYSLSRKYTEDTVIGLGALKGAPCTIQSIIDDGTSNQVTFKWTGSDGTEKTQAMAVKHGVSIVSVNIDDDNHLICLLSDGTTIDSGSIDIEGQSTLSEPITVTTTIGSATGKTYPKGTSIEDIIRDILITYQKCGLTVSLNPVEELYDIVEDTLDKITTKAVVTKGTNNIIEVSFFVDGIELKEITSGVANGGTFSYEHTFTPPTNKTFTIKVTATDGKQANTVTKTITFIGKSYFGTVAEDVIIPTEADIKSLQNNVLKNTRKLVYSGIQVDYGKVLYAYPKSLGALTKIVDADGRDYTASYESGEVLVDGIEYRYYILIDAMGTDDGYQSFV